MGNKQCISLNLLLSDDTFAVISVMTTLGTAILGGIAPSIYGIFTSPIDKKVVLGLLAIGSKNKEIMLKI